MNANMQFGRGSLVADPSWVWHAHYCHVISVLIFQHLIQDPGEDPNFLFIVGQEGACKCVVVLHQCSYF